MKAYYMKEAAHIHYSSRRQNVDLYKKLKGKFDCSQLKDKLS